MKKILSYLTVMTLIMVGGCQNYDDAPLWNDIDDLRNRVETLEKLVATTNSNISALQGIVTALQGYDYVTGVTRFTTPEPGGYTISFTQSDPVTILNGQDGQDGQDGTSPQISVRQDADGEYYWTLNGEWILADGKKQRVTGQDGSDGINPRIRINPDTYEWEVSYDNGTTWDATGMTASGGEGNNGDAIFAADGVDYSADAYVEFTLADADSTKIRLRKYLPLGLDFEQPTAFAAGETKRIPYRATGKVEVIRFLDVPDGWTMTVNKVDSTFVVTAPAPFNTSNMVGEVILLVAGENHDMVMYIINILSTDATIIKIDGYQGNITVHYTDNTSDFVTANSENAFVVPEDNKVIRSIELEEGGTNILVGRKTEGRAISLKLDEAGNPALRDALDGYIPIGTYAEFQLINTNAATLAGRYRQEANLDLLSLEWRPIGVSNNPFTGTFDGGMDTITNLQVTGNGDYVGLFGNISGANLRNIAGVSGSVSGGNLVGGLCGRSDRSNIGNCSNSVSVSGNNGSVGGVCGFADGGAMTACRNSGSVSGNNGSVGGMVGSAAASSTAIAITACYNTGAISGAGDVGGVVGSVVASSSAIAITACYNTGAVSGSSATVGGLCGNSSSSTITACYWYDLPGDDAVFGIGSSLSDTGATKFGPTAWPATSTHTSWGTGDGSGNGKYWKALGGWDAVSPVFPKLFFEE